MDDALSFENTKLIRIQFDLNPNLCDFTALRCVDWLPESFFFFSNPVVIKIKPFYWSEKLQTLSVAKGFLSLLDSAQSQRKL